MSLGPVSLARLAQVHPVLAARIKVLVTRVSEPIGVTQALRTSREQAALYAQGRLGLDAVNQLRRAAGMAVIDERANANKVTDADAGYSWHEYGLAVDVVPFESSGQADWNKSHPIWQEIVAAGEALGLTSGEAWHDMPHLQITGKYPVAAPDDEVRSLMASGGLQAVWAASEITS